MKRPLAPRLLCYSLAAALLASAALASTAWAGPALWLHKDAAKGKPEFNKIWDYRPSLVTTVYARDGRVLGQLYREKRYLVQLSDLSPMLIKAFLAAEDSAFFEHEGVDLTAIFRALSKNLASGEVVQGASTITQQVVKRILLTSERSYARKIKEAILSYRLEHQMSKEEILTIYLNEIFMGSNAYGVEAAARTYFAKHAPQLTIAECALLAGLPKAPTKFNPYRYPEEAKNRQKYVLGRMVELGWITGPEYETAIKQPLEYKSMPDPSWQQGAYYLEEVRRWLVENLGKKGILPEALLWGRKGEDAVYEAGLHVYTAIDLDHQAAAEKALREGLETTSKRRGFRGPIKHLEPAEYAAFLDKQDFDEDELLKGVRQQALVLEVAQAGAKVQIGKRHGAIDIKNMKWAHAINPNYDAEGMSINDARKALKPGDVVLVSFIEHAVPGKPYQLALEQRPDVEGALVSIEPPTGDVVALVGGYDFNESQFNRATQAWRQPGSSFKPIVYSAAIDAGFTPASVVMDEPFVVYDPHTGKTWEPKNYSNEIYGPTLLATALAKSRNLVTIRVAEIIGIKRVIERAKALGLHGDWQPYLPICLGSVAVTPINLCQAYTAFARDGTYVSPRLVTSIKNNERVEVYNAPVDAVRAISPQNAFIMASMLKETVIRGTATRARALKRPVAGKTGTTNDEQDAWFIGFSPYLLSGVWVGLDHVTPMGKKETGSRISLPIWLKYRQAMEDRYPVQDFTVPEGIYFKNVSGNALSSEYESESGAKVQSAKDYNLPFMVNAPPPISDPHASGDGEGRDEGGSGKHGGSQEEYLLKQLF
jgi:penicillin-binding protein 1A